MLFKIFNFQTKTIKSGALILGIFYSISALLGLVRDRFLAGRFGAGLELDVYFAAFRIPDFVYNFLILGGLTVTFLPLFSEYFSRNKEDAWKMTNHILNVFLFFLILISLILFIFTPWLIKWLFPGFGPSHYELAIPLVRLLLLGPIFFGISNIFSGILQYFNRFVIYGLTPVLYNLGIIFGILFLTPQFGIFGVAIGVILGAFFHMAIQIPSIINCGFSYKFLFNFRYPAIIRTFNLMIPRVFAIAAQQINLIIITAIASLIAVGSITIFNFSNNLQSLPIGIIAISFTVAAFPVLSRNWAQNQKKEFLENFSKTFRQILFCIIPISVFIFLFKNQIASFVYESEKFGFQDVKLTAISLGIFAISLFAQSLNPLIVRAFFSWQDTKTPTFVTFFSVILNIVLAFTFVWLLSFSNLFSSFIENFFNLQKIENIAIVGLPLAFSFSAIFQFILLLFFFNQRIKKLI